MSTSPVKAIVPAYFHPAADPDAWHRLARAAPQVRLAVVNVHDGPGDAPDGEYVDAVGLLQSSRVPLAGYVDTDYGRRDIGQVAIEIERYRDWYGVNALFFDQVSSQRRELAYYEALTGRARAMGADEIAFNHGMHPAEPYAELADLVGTFEGPWRHYAEISPPGWVRSWPAQRFFHLVYSVPHSRFAQACALVSSRGAGSAFVTGHGGDNPWDHLPETLFDCLIPQ
jgi:hypothetical protein